MGSLKDLIQGHIDEHNLSVQLIRVYPIPELQWKWFIATKKSYRGN